LRKQHYGAVHFCYAFQIGTDKIQYRANDDGEPSNTAGAPIYGQIQSFGLTNVLVVVVRFFGGIKLGVGGLISAYRTSAQMALEASEIIEKNLNIISQNMNESCEIEIATRKKNAEQILDIFNNLFEIEIVIKN
jgi:putative IMPACT (imprinted ancient) family translation regulator